jgi:type II secretory pathway pseudopilin PulG
MTLSNSTTPHATSRRSAFTLTEITIVIGIIVLIIAISLPAFNILSGSRSLDGATNEMSALMARARTEALASQKFCGVLFYIDPTTQRRSAVLVQSTASKGSVDIASPYGSIEVWLDLIPDREPVRLPSRVGVQTILDSSLAVSGTTYTRTSDGYFGFNDQGGALVGGVILFDTTGKMTLQRYGFRMSNNTGSRNASANDTSFNPARDTRTELCKLLYPTATTATDFAMLHTVVQVPPIPPLRSQVGVVLYELPAFEERAFTVGDPQFDSRNGAGFYTSTTLGASEQEEETWIDSNCVLLLINRFNGTLIRSE